MPGLMLALALAAAPTPPDHVHQYRDVVISPKGDLIAAIESDDPFASEAEPHPVVVMRSAKDGAVIAKYDPCAKCFYSGAAWSPDGSGLVFVSTERKTRTATLEVVRDGKTAEALVFPGLLETPRWSPDGKTFAVLATERPRKIGGATQAGAANVGEIGSATDEQRVAVLPASGGPLKFLSPADTYVYEYDWAPDGKAFAVTAAKGDGDNNWWIAKLAAVGLDGSFREIADPGVQMKWPKVTPDGKSVTFIGGLHSDFGPTGGDLWVAPFAGGKAVDKTPAYKGSFTSLAWRGKTLFATAIEGDHNAVLTVDPASGATKTLLSGPVSMSSGEGKVSLSADGKLLAGVAEDFTSPPHIGAGPVASPRQITHDNDALTPQVTARSITWKNDGYDVQGWLTGPANLEPGKKYPMVVLVHGGPSSAVQPSYMWKGTTNDLVQHGFFVFQANPRGSFGQGEAFTKANVKDFGGGDLRDILAGVDAVEKVAPVDDKRLGVYGHSYGGYMTMWTVTHSNRFKAAVAGAGIADWVSYYGENGINQWMVPFFGTSAYKDPAAYDKFSPIRYINAAKTPTFIYVGERDVECPADQSLQFHAGLDAVGVANSLVIYAGEGHGIREAEHKEDLKKRILGWFDQYLTQS
ncbi:S9 family peptidase [Phenylobacterium sp.]|jgi:dipeptidyl aminopeptidase/acylaminoacyl peptidase|uniref:S9 family peptidase n=1 Tax=Phenylobacterium sp. TaxID=1871053 RepID=UPI002E31ED4A|nr:S9 family peptidase [Phenylobacterium sp.]HEX3366418.1 S9 family peptidase [Phenylobacterium sp.]